MKVVLFAMTFVLLMTTAPKADDRGTPDEARAIAIRAAEYLRQNGAEKAFPLFNDGADFHDRDLYVFVQLTEGTIVANGANKAVIGKNLIEMRDVDGKIIGHEISATKDAGWVEFKWRNPKTNAVELKTTYVVRVGDYLVGVGAYQN